MLSVAEVKKLYRGLDRRRIPIESISIGEAVDMLRQIPAGTGLTILSRTQAREVRKAGVPHPYRDCCVVKRRTVLLKEEYQRAVNEQRVREGNRPDFQAKPRSWGEKIEPPFVLCRPKGRGWGVYVSLQVVKTLGTAYFTWGGDPIDIEEVRPHLRPPRGPGRQGLDRPVRHRDYEIVNILAYILPVVGGREAGFVIDLKDAYKATVKGGRLEYTCQLTPGRRPKGVRGAR